MDAEQLYELGQELRASAIDAHGFLPNHQMAYGFLLDNPECFWQDNLDDMPEDGWGDLLPRDFAPIALQAGYYGLPPATE